MKIQPIFYFLVILALLAAKPAQALNFQFEVVGNAGNAADPLNSGSIPGIGSVADEYRIATTEVTIGQYTEFLNAVADTDANGLYHPSMGTNGNIGNIIQSGSSGGFSYAVQGGDDPNLPVTYVDWYDTLRFANWMHNGQMDTGSQSASTTEDGAYTFTGTTTVGARNGGAEFFLPTENEWYKAAYHQPSAQGGDGDDYWLYPFQTNSVPFSDNPTSLNTPDDTRAANFFRNVLADIGYNDGYAVSGSTSFPSGLPLTPVGAYGDATSYYGAFDMGGNVWEWNETTVFGSLRGVRGGSWTNDENELQSTLQDHFNPADELFTIGFRLAEVIPEPSRVVLIALGAVGVLSQRRRPRLAL